MGDNSIVGATSVLWRVFSTVEGQHQYCGDITAVHVGDSFNTGGIPSVLWSCSVHWGITSVQWGIASVLWRVFSTLRG